MCNAEAMPQEKQISHAIATYYDSIPARNHLSMPLIFLYAQDSISLLLCVGRGTSTTTEHQFPRVFCELAANGGQ